MTDCLFLRGLRLEAMVGVYGHEKESKRPLILDLELYIDASIAAKSDSILDTVDYDLVASFIFEQVSQSKFNLIESLATAITQAILEKFNLTRVKCTLYKPQAVSHVETVGIIIERAKANL
jgi:dihydroneopterin aldolase